MRAKYAYKIHVATILLGILVPSTALGSHAQSSPSPGPPNMHIPKPDNNVASPKGPNISALGKPITSTVAHAPAKPPPIHQVVEQKKPQAKSHTNLGWRFLLSGQPQAALAAYHEALRTNPESAHAYLGLGISLKSLGEVQLAKKALDKAVVLDPRLPSALVHLGYLYAEGHFGQADLTTAHRLFKEASQLGDPFASIAILDIESRSQL